MAALVLAGCVAGDPFAPILDGYVGKPQGVLVDRIGIPDSDTVIMGRRVLTWDKRTQIHYLFGGSETYFCKMRFVIDENDKIAGWQREGDCVGYILKLRTT